jgi:hypothetical protein
MPLSTLISAPRNQAELEQWSFANMVNHRDIIRRVQETKGIELIESPLDPFDPDDPTSLNNFLQVHYAMHVQFDAALGLVSYPLNVVDWKNPQELAQWIWLHSVEHQAASQILGIG